MIAIAKKTGYDSSAPSCCDRFSCYGCSGDAPGCRRLADQKAKANGSFGNKSSASPTGSKSAKKISKSTTLPTSGLVCVASPCGERFRTSPLESTCSRSSSTSTCSTRSARKHLCRPLQTNRSGTRNVANFLGTGKSFAGYVAETSRRMPPSSSMFFKRTDGPIESTVRYRRPDYLASHRLRETVRTLNQKLTQIRFRADGTGEGIL